MGQRRRIVVRAYIFLMLGAIINVAVAWGICVWTPLKKHFSAVHLQGKSDSWISPAPPNHPYPALRFERLSSGMQISILQSSAPNQTPPLTVYRQHKVAAGMPMLSCSMVAEMDFGYQKDTNVRRWLGQIPLPITARASRWQTPVEGLPIAPL
jgi:hypothetical protein